MVKTRARATGWGVRPGLGLGSQLSRPNVRVTARAGASLGQCRSPGRGYKDGALSRGKVGAGIQARWCSHEAVVGPCARPPPPKVTCRWQRSSVSGCGGRLQRAQRCSRGAKRGGEGVCNGCGEGAESVRARRGRGHDARGCVEAPKASRSVIPPCNTCAGTKSPSL